MQSLLRGRLCDVCGQNEQRRTVHEDYTYSLITTTAINRCRAMLVMFVIVMYVSDVWSVFVSQNCFRVECKINVKIGKREIEDYKYRILTLFLSSWLAAVMKVIRN